MRVRVLSDRAKRPEQTEFRFDGETYDDALDRARLNAQLRRVRDVMLDGGWRTLAEIRTITGDPEASISARLRDLRKPRFGAWTVERQRRGYPTRGLFEYRLTRRER